MKMKNPLVVVRDLAQAKAFYRETLGLRVVLDFGANVTLTGGLNLQTLESWCGFINAAPADIAFGGCDAEIYFEEEDFDAFIAHLAGVQGVRYVHPAVEHSWGQRAVRFFDPDGHIIEVGEPIQAVCRRMLEGGMTQEQAAARMDVPLSLVRRWAR